MNPKPAPHPYPQPPHPKLQAATGSALTGHTSRRSGSALAAAAGPDNDICMMLRPATSSPQSMGGWSSSDGGSDYSTSSLPPGGEGSSHHGGTAARAGLVAAAFSGAGPRSFAPARTPLLAQEGSRGNGRLAAARFAVQRADAAFPPGANAVAVHALPPEWRRFAARRAACCKRSSRLRVAHACGCGESWWCLLVVLNWASHFLRQFCAYLPSFNDVPQVEAARSKCC